MLLLLSNLVYMSTTWITLEHSTHVRLSDNSKHFLTSIPIFFGTFCESIIKYALQKLGANFKANWRVVTSIWLCKSCSQVAHLQTSWATELMLLMWLGVCMRRVSLSQAMHPDRCAQRPRSAELATACRFVELALIMWSFYASFKHIPEIVMMAEPRRWPETGLTVFRIVPLSGK